MKTLKNTVIITTLLTCAIMSIGCSNRASVSPSPVPVQEVKKDRPWADDGGLKFAGAFWIAGF